MALPITLAAPAKINLALSVGRARLDGYHPIASWMVALDFADRVTVERLEAGPSGASTFEIAFVKDAPLPQAVDWPVEKDLAYRAHQLMEEAAGRALPVAVRIDKRIPAGAGLAGGSADAAAMLVAVDELFELNMDDAALASVATKLGCDVAFSLAAIRGQPAALATGLGEQLAASQLARPVDVVLILPPFGCPTAKVYAAFDAAGAAAGEPDLSRVQVLAAVGGEGDVRANSLFNDLAASAMQVQPRLTAARAAVGDAVSAATGQALPVHITGSGSGMFLLAKDQAQARRLAQTIRQRTALPAIATRTRRLAAK